jgi:hypothetical protein
MKFSKIQTMKKIQMQIINTLANLHAANMNLNSEGNIIQQAYDKVQTLEEIQKRNREEAVFSAEDVKENEGKEKVNEKEDCQEDEEPKSTPIVQEEDEQIEEE